MASTAVRRFTISDMMIVVPAAAVGAVILRAYLPGHYAQLGRLPTLIGDRWGFWRFYVWIQGPGSCLVVPLMAAAIGLRLRSPRPRWSRLVRQPGFVACVAVLVSAIPGLVWTATIYHRPGFREADGFRPAWTTTLEFAGTAVLGSWFALALSRRWRPECSWIDRLGRILGLYWLLLLFTFFALQWLDMLQRTFSLGGAP